MNRRKFSFMKRYLKKIFIFKGNWNCFLLLSIVVSCNRINCEDTCILKSPTIQNLTSSYPALNNQFQLMARICSYITIALKNPEYNEYIPLYKFNTYWHRKLHDHHRMGASLYRKWKIENICASRLLSNGMRFWHIHI